MKLYRFVFLTTLLLVNYTIAKANSIKRAIITNKSIFSKKNANNNENFILDQYLGNDNIILAAHRSHRSHSSHTSHTSHRSGAYHRNHVSHVSHRSASSTTTTPSTTSVNSITDSDSKPLPSKEKENISDYDKAMNCMYKKEYEKAKPFFKLALQEKNCSWKVSYNYAICLYRSGKYLQAKERFQKIQSSAPKTLTDRIAYYIKKISNFHIALQFYREKNYLESNKYFELAIKEEPDKWSIYYWYSNCLVAMGKYDKALLQLKIAQKLAKKDKQIAYTIQAITNINLKLKKLKNSQNEQ